jgi:hypothetical protein
MAWRVEVWEKLWKGHMSRSLLNNFICMLERLLDSLITHCMNEFTCARRALVCLCRATLMMLLSLACRIPVSKPNESNHIPSIRTSTQAQIFSPSICDYASKGCICCFARSLKKNETIINTVQHRHLQLSPACRLPSSSQAKIGIPCAINRDC